MIKETRVIETKNGNVAAVNSDTPIITDGQSAMDFAVRFGYEQDCIDIIVNEEAIAEDFFDLSTGLAGEVVQKFVNFGFRLTITGDFSGYTSKSLQDFIFESNKGRHLYFVADEEAAIKRIESSYR